MAGGLGIRIFEPQGSGLRSGMAFPPSQKSMILPRQIVPFDLLGIRAVSADERSLRRQAMLRGLGKLSSLKVMPYSFGGAETWRRPRPMTFGVHDKKTRAFESLVHPPRSFYARHAVDQIAGKEYWTCCDVRGNFVFVTKRPSRNYWPVERASMARRLKVSPPGCNFVHLFPLHCCELLV